MTRPAETGIQKTAEWAGPDRHYRQCVPGQHRHWGADGAAGALAWTAGRDGKRYVLLAKRSKHVQAGGTWAFPGGAIDAGENALAAAVRELDEEVAGVPTLVSLTAERKAGCPHGCGWSYTSFAVEVENTAECDRRTGRIPNVPRVAIAAGPSAWETDAVAWFPLDYVTELRLHPAFAASWPELKSLIERA